MVPRVAVVDYHKGNLKSVERGIDAAGGRAFITDDAASIARADAIVLPGVGAFADAASSMSALGQMDVIRDRIADGAFFLGICLGMHLLFEEGVEGALQEDDEESTHNARGLSILPGVVQAMPKVDAEGNRFKVPHVGWNSLNPSRSGSSDEEAGCALERTDEEFSSPLLANIKPGEFFYFTHGYIVPDTPCTQAVTKHSLLFPSVVSYRDTAYGVQFHPEKSSDAGALLLRNFISIVKGA